MVGRAYGVNSNMEWTDDKVLHLIDLLTDVLAYYDVRCDLCTPDFGHAFSNRSYLRECGRFWMSSVQRAWRLRGEKKKEEERRKKNNLW